MKASYPFVLAAADLGSAVPIFSLPAFSIPSFSIPSFSIPGLPSPATPTSLSSFPAITTLPDSPILTSSIFARTASVSEASVAIAIATSASCTPQSTAGGSTENGVTDKNCCTDLTLMFARGTIETGNVGTVAGPPMFEALRSSLPGRVTVQGVDYPADIAGNAGLGASGGPTMASLVKQALSQCPNTKIVVSGYSQGAMVVHNAFSAQGLTAQQVTAAVLFGDPLINQSISALTNDTVKEFCASGDSICGGTGVVITPAHLTYGDDAQAAAEWIVEATGL